MVLLYPQNLNSVHTESARCVRVGCNAVYVLGYTFQGFKGFDGWKRRLRQLVTSPGPYPHAFMFSVRPYLQEKEELVTALYRERFNYILRGILNNFDSLPEIMEICRIMASLQDIPQVFEVIR